MMTRTQIYLPEETHANLINLAKIENVSLSELIRKGADLVIKTKQKGMSPHRQTLKMLADYPESLRIKLSDSAINLIRKQRD
jgi:hypothetical protein